MGSTRKKYILRPEEGAVDNTITLPYRFIPRQYQLRSLEAFALGHRRMVQVWHRRAGKDRTDWAAIMVPEALRTVGNYAYVFPEQKQGRKVIWEGIADDGSQGFPYLEHIPRILVERQNASEMFVKLTNGSTIQIAGTDNYNSLMGTNYRGIVFSEYSIQNPLAWEYLKPILRVNKGWAIFNMTPRGRNHGWKLWNIAIRNGWFAELLTYKDTGVVTDEDIQQERLEGMTEEQIAQEYMCSWDSGMPGAYYTDVLARAREDGRICSVPVQTHIPVDLWFDLGYSDSTSIWFTQNVGREVHVVDYMEMTGEAIAEIARKLDEKRYVFGEITLPHDAAHVTLAGGGRSQAEQLMQAMRRKVQVSPKLDVNDGISAVRAIFPICYFDEERCSKGLEALSCYHKEYDQKAQDFKSKPKHDWASHAADAFRTFATSHNFAMMARRHNRRLDRPQSIGIDRPQKRPNRWGAWT